MQSSFLKAHNRLFSYNHKLIYFSTGTSLEVWGGQMGSEGQTNGSSTYILDGEEPSANTNVPTATPTSRTILFHTSGLANSRHTVTILNNGVTMGLNLFKVENVDTSAPTPPPSILPGPSVSSSVLATTISTAYVGRSTRSVTSLTTNL